ncbi:MULTISPECIES: phage tail terminator-like protein [unclassified Chelatococcus]|uniref:phage tail terminator-like protein n=1 Tax=unclassified Chelatococcus TaxID=2638111 RepID=UPI001BCA8F34|nr:MULTISPECIES: phage tail terminator-like protein [unclassified Chelatococcus]CAH1670757.1 conserved hypothetical protein [Hyphomicrobiales bacterium]MBS7738377.1 hypothetical protein [Chelatococcus sp. HY11]MBX3547354.1 hypothetical protein [Chelatococcus sp.]MCO5077277.1 DUF4128 domain-containing protein [Chelatococcus sp.]CAH1677016.1 conserved hypothetical protein [Hyphomicrobiales bacterium]
MPSQLVVNAVEARLAALWSRCPVFGINQEATAPDDASPYLAVQYPVANRDQITIGAPGNNVFREEGAFRFVLHTERGAGPAKALAWADELALIFQAKQFGGVTTWAPSPPTLDERNYDGNYCVVSFAVPYFADTRG